MRKHDLKPILKALRRQGWTDEIRRSGHIKLTSPSGAPYFTSASPSDCRGLKNMIADLRRMGASL